MKIKSIESDIQSGFTRYAKKEENFTCTEEKKQSIEADPEVTQIELDMGLEYLVELDPTRS